MNRKPGRKPGQTKTNYKPVAPEGTSHARGCRYKCGCTVSSDHDETPVEVFPKLCFDHKTPIMCYFVNTRPKKEPPCG